MTLFGKKIEFFCRSINKKTKRLMKKKFIITTLAVFFIGAQAIAQTPAKDKEQSNAEIFSAKAGTLMQKEFIEIGTVEKANVKVLYYTDLISNSKTNALKFEMDVVTSYATDTKAAMLDVDEIDGLMKSIKLMQDKVMITVPTNYTEVYYRSRGGFEAGCFTSKGAWSCYLKLEKFDSKSYVWLKAADLTTLYGLLEQAKAKM
jgi:hypothetical protein